MFQREDFPELWFCNSASPETKMISSSIQKWLENLRRIIELPVLNHFGLLGQKCWKLLGIPFIWSNFDKFYSCEQ